MFTFIENTIERFIPALKEKDLWRLMRENLHEQRKLYIIAVVAMFMVAATTSSVAWIMRYIVDAMTIPDNQGMVLMVAAGVAVIFTLKGMATYIQTIALTRAGNRIVAHQQIKLYDKLLRQGVSFFNLTESSDLLMRVTQSAQAARMIIDLLVTSFVRDLLTLIGLLTVMFYQQPVLSSVSILIGPVAIFGIRLLLQKVRKIMEQEMASLSEIIKVIQETSTGIRIIKAFALEERMASRMNKAVREVEKRSNAISRLEAITSPLMDTLSGFAIAAVVALSAVQIFGVQGTTPGQLMSFVTALLMAYEPAKRLSRMRITIESGMVGVRMMFGLLDQPETLAEHPDPVTMQPGPGRIVFDHVSFEYGKERPVIRDMSIAFEAGKTTALVGPSGGGKSTILNLILRLYDPNSGAVRIDGVDIKTASFASLRDKISFVGQDTFLFSATIAENIRFGSPGATEEDVIEACKAANAHEFIETMQHGYYTQVGENGAFLSGGQKQRLAIARAILRNAPILLLDEATSALDSRSEALVQDAIQRLTRDRTTVVIAHRLSTVLGADKICVIDQGTLAEEGTVNALLSRGGMFRGLYDQQFGAADKRNTA
ncbi:MAG: ABC transporter ATP-binding protein [Cereibacter sphaeroides]|uniref:ABC transporter ATP-binding protein n=1 Tax=Cereibacter sphaeroides TaxID=1063 RepID=A0A2W5S0S1_CERSP|nr:MAG: ABC transporter ATP-binding protein [Cereibacter sphaeroides]